MDMQDYRDGKGTDWRFRPRDPQASHRAIGLGHNPATGDATIECQCGTAIHADSIELTRALWSAHIERALRFA